MAKCPRHFLFDPTCRTCVLMDNQHSKAVAEAEEYRRRKRIEAQETADRNRRAREARQQPVGQPATSSGGGTLSLLGSLALWGTGSALEASERRKDSKQIDAAQAEARRREIRWEREFWDFDQVMEARAHEQISIAEAQARLAIFVDRTWGEDVDSARAGLIARGQASARVVDVVGVQQAIFQAVALRKERLLNDAVPAAPGYYLVEDGYTGVWWTGFSWRPVDYVYLPRHTPGEQEPGIYSVKPGVEALWNGKVWTEIQKGGYQR